MIMSTGRQVAVVDVPQLDLRLARDRTGRTRLARRALGWRVVGVAIPTWCSARFGSATNPKGSPPSSCSPAPAECTAGKCWVSDSCSTRTPLRTSPRRRPPSCTPQGTWDQPCSTSRWRSDLRRTSSTSLHPLPRSHPPPGAAG